MMALAAELYPICRSITGAGVRETLARLQGIVDLEQKSIPSGTHVLDWTIPDEWNIRDAYVKNASGKRVIDFRASNLHVVSYSVPVRATMSLAELRPHLYTLPEQPELIPYRTSYYDAMWGFCLSQRQLETLPEGDYEVVIDSSLAPGVLNYGEFLLKGQSDAEVLFSTHICHPSLANDNLSGIAVLAFLAQALARRGGLRYSYRFLFIPGTIGAIGWLAQNEDAVDRINYGLVVSGVGDAGDLHYKVSRRGNAPIDRTARRVLEAAARPFEILPWHPYGYDERQFGSPGFDLPVGRLSRTPYAQYPQYHSSADNLDFIGAEALEETLQVCLALVGELETQELFLNTVSKGEPQLGRRGLYEAFAGQKDLQLATLWVLNLSDGAHSLHDIADASKFPLTLIKQAKDLLISRDLLNPFES